MLVQLIVTLNNDYAFGTEERERLVGIESLWDPGSQALLTEVGLSAGWNCLELGAGAGSLVKWMAEQDANVTAVDLDTRHVDHLQSDSVTLIQGDIRQQQLPQAAFDVVHARLVLQHLPDRRQVIDQLVTTLRPGGWLVLEDFDWSTFAWHGHGGEVVNVVEACLDVMSQMGAEINYGRRLVRDLVDGGLTDVRGQGRAPTIDSASPAVAFFTHSMESLRETIIDKGLVSAEQIAVARRELQGDLRMTMPTMMAALGRRP